MSIALQNEINQLKERVEKLERFMNKRNDEPRKVAGKPDPIEKPAPKKRTIKKVEGND